MTGSLRTTWRAAACALAAACTSAVTASAATAADAPACPSSTDAPYTMHLRALTAPAGADLTIRLESAVAACAVPAELKKVQLKTYAGDGSLDRTRNVTDIAAAGGVAVLDLGPVAAHRRVDAEVLVQTASRTYILRETTTTLLRPDLVASVDAPKQVLAGRPFDVKVVVSERNKDVGASATVALPGVGLAKHVEVAAGGSETIVFQDVVLPQRGHVDLAAEVRDAAPAETDASNNGATAPIDVLLPPDLVVQSVDAPKQVLVGKAFTVTVVVAERNKDVGATATVALPADPTATKRVEVAAGGTATVVFDGVVLTNHAHGLALTAAITDAAPAETDTTNNTLSTAIDVLRPPDLVVRSIAPQQALVGSAFTVSVVVAEANGDLPATATVTMSAVPGASQPVSVPAGGTTTVTFPGVKFDAAVRVDVTATVVGAVPDESDATNNTLTSPIDITKSAVNLPTVLFPSLGGYGTQFGDHVYAPVTPWPAGVGYAGFEDKVKALEPQLVRIFYNDNWDANANGKFAGWQTNYASFVRAVELAQQAGATVDISFQNLGNVVTTPTTPKPLYTADQAMTKFADVFVDLVVNHGFTNVRWAEVANEPNSPGGATTLQLYSDLVRALDAHLRERGLRDQVHIMGGGLIESTGDRSHYAWLSWIAQNLGDVVDAYAEHVYWWYDRPGRLDYRLRDTYYLATQALAPELQKPMYQMEFGIRGYTSCAGKPTLPSQDYLYYRDANCTDIWRTNIAGFQQLWFEIEAAQLGVAGTSKWDAYWSRYDTSSANNQVYWTIGPPTEGSPLTPTYYALSLLFHATAPGWKIVRVDPWDSNDYGVPATNVSGGESSNDQPEEELVAYAGPNGELTVMGLDTHGRDLNAASTDPPSSYSIGGLPPNTTFHLALWNATGDGTNSVAPDVVTSAAGVARFDVPLQAAFALTTVPVS